MAGSFIHGPVMVVVVLLIGAFLIPLLHRRENWIKWVFLTCGAVAFALSLYNANMVLRLGTLSYALGGWLPPHGIELVVDAFAAYSSLVIAGVSLLIMWYAAWAPEEVKSPSGYYALVLLLGAAMHGIVMAGDLFNLFVFVEISSLAAIAIIAVKGTMDSIEASFRYLVLSALGSGGILFSIAFIFMISGHLNMAYIHESLKVTSTLYPLNILTALSFMFIGFAIKAALFPLHVWLPEAHSNAPTASSALLSGLVVKVYIIGFMRIIYLAIGMEIFQLLPMREIFLVLSTLAILVGSVLAMVQENLKRMLAYSTVAQVGYIFLGFGLLSTRAVEGATLHILNHAITKALLFLVAGTIIKQTGTNKLSELKGMGRRMPWTFGALTIGVLSMVGIPGLAGFVSKLYLALGALDIGMVPFAVLMLISSLLNATYYFPIVINAFFGNVDSVRNGADPKPQLLMPIAILAVLCVFFGLFPSWTVPLIRQTAQLFVR